MEQINKIKFPEQGPFLGRLVEVCFEFDTSLTFVGSVVREDSEAPGLMIIMLQNGRYVMSTECSYRPLNEKEAHDFMEAELLFEFIESYTEAIVNDDTPDGAFWAVHEEAVRAYNDTTRKKIDWFDIQGDYIDWKNKKNDYPIDPTLATMIADMNGEIEG